MPIRRLINQVADGSVLSGVGDLIFVSNKRFVKLFKSPDICFICCRKLDDLDTDREHITPLWIQRRCDLSNKSITLPNGTRHKYSTYTVPACIECNSFLSRTYENVIAAAFDNGLDGIAELVRTNSALLFEWACLLYFKMHFRDLTTPSNRDLRKNEGNVGDIYDLSEFHHLHAIIRSRKYETLIDPGVIGTVRPIQIDDDVHNYQFDYSDHFLSQTMMVRIGSIAIIFVLNDSGKVDDVAQDLLAKINSPIRFVHLIEILTDHQCINMHIVERPTYMSSFNEQLGRFVISVVFPKSFDLHPTNWHLRGTLLLFNFRALLPYMHIGQFSQSALKEEMSKGRMSFIGHEVSRIGPLPEL